MLVIMVMGMVLPVFQTLGFDNEALSGDAGLHDRFRRSRPLLVDRETAEQLPEFRAVGAGVEQGCREHVAGEAGEWIDVERTHRITGPGCGLIRLLERILA